MKTAGVSAVIVSAGQMGWTEASHGSRYAFRRKQLSDGGGRLGCSLYEVAPGKSAWPRHYHCTNEEAIYVLEGTATLRLGERTVEVGPGDYVAMPAGAAAAHQLINTSTAPIRYLCFSTMDEPEVSFYPGSGKIGVMVGAPPGGIKERRTFSKTFRVASDVDYWEGEE